VDHKYEDFDFGMDHGWMLHCYVYLMYIYNCKSGHGWMASLFVTLWACGLSTRPNKTYKINLNCPIKICPLKFLSSLFSLYVYFISHAWWARALYACSMPLYPPNPKVKIFFSGFSVGLTWW
jgi:hypothetical protein